MRLTLRQLLSYLDDTLEPSQAKQIGQKIAENPGTQDLIARIREVVRRRLTTPPETGPDAKLDANTIAEYIDGLLPADKLNEVEQVCLDSDVYLAEIAACHQILTLVLSEPVLIPPTSRQRMYGLIQGREAIPYRKPAAAASEPTDSELVEANEADEALLLGLPFYRRGGSWWRRLVPAALVLLLVVGLGVAIWQAMPSSHEPSASGTPVAVRNNPAPKEPPGKPAPVGEQAKKEGPAKQVAAAPSKPPSPAPETKAVPDAGASGGAEAEAAKKPPVETAILATTPSTDRKPAGRYVSGMTPTVLLYRAGTEGLWQRLVRDSTVFTNDHLVSLPSYRSELRLDSGVHLVLWGDFPDGTSPTLMLESGVRLHANPSVDLDFTLERGRVAFSNHKSSGPAHVRFRVLSEVWDLTLLEAGTEVAAEIVGSPDFGFKKNPTANEGPIVGVGVYVLQGQASLKIGYVTHLMREARGPALFVWNNREGVAPAPRTQAPEDLPAWARGRITAPGKEAQGLRQAEVILANRLSGKAPVEVVLQEALIEPEAINRILAVYSLGATDDLPLLLDTLADERRADVRLTTITALRYWIGQSRDHDLQLYQALESKYRSRPAEIIMTLLHPYSLRQWQEPETYETLIAYLQNDKLPIRQLAHWHLVTMVPEGRDIPYDPAGGTDQRDFAYEKWKKLIPSGKLPPRRPASSPGSGTPNPDRQGNRTPRG